MDYLHERRAIVAAAQEILSSGMVIGTWGNVSVKIKDQPMVLITPSGMDYRTMLTDDIVLVDMEGKTAPDQWKPSTELPLHLAVYKHRHDLQAIVHVHSPYASAFAAARQSIPVILEETAQVIGHEILSAPYASTGSEQLAANVVKALGGGRALLLANHGLLGMGRDIAEALRVCRIAEETARVAILARSLGDVCILPPDEVSSLHHRFQHYGQPANNRSSKSDSGETI